MRQTTIQSEHSDDLVSLVANAHILLERDEIIVLDENGVPMELPEDEESAMPPRLKK